MRLARETAAMGGVGSAPRQRAYRLGDYLRAGATVLRHLPALRAARRAGRVAPAFVHAIQLAVSEVNGCRFCSYEHAARLLESGASDRELAQMLAGALDAVPPEQVVALMSAQHYAERGGRPEPAALARLATYYGPATGRDILNYIRLVHWGSVGGNILAAFDARLRGAPVPGSALWSELPVALLIGPAYLSAMARGRRSGRYGRVHTAMRHRPRRVD